MPQTLKNIITFSGIILLLMVGVYDPVYAQDADRIDLNTAEVAEINRLPLSAAQVAAILEWREFVGPFNNIYDLQKVRGIDFDTFLKLKPLVCVTPVFLEESVQRIEDNYYKVEQWMSDEGANENLVSSWIDRMADPVNVNRLGFYDLLNLAGVSPVDALAIRKRQQTGLIINRQDLRNTDFLSYYGFSNLEDFIRYDDPTESQELGGSFASVIKNITLSQTPTDDASSYSEFKARDYPLDTFHRLRLHWRSRYRFELSYLRNLGEPALYYRSGQFKVPEFKAFFEITNQKIGPLNIHDLVVGDYTASFGQGVAFEATDYFIPRKSGMGWRKRYSGISGDISRSTEYALRGVGIEAGLGKLIASGFYSFNRRDAIINKDSSFTSLITMYPCLEYGLYDSIPNSLTRSVGELLIGGNLRYEVLPGTYLGTTIYQSLYERRLDPQVEESLLNASGTGKYLTQIGNTADAEIAASYHSDLSSRLWSAARAGRRVVGLDFLSVIKNLAVQGEIAQLDGNFDLWNGKNDPIAWVLSGYLQFDNFNFFLLYRDYDLNFDNPYQRSFSNYQRYKGSIFEDIFYLKDPILGYLYSAAPQPQAEKGLYYSTRYQLHRTTVVQVEQDIWQRVADKAQFNRLVLNFEYRPVFNYRFRLRQKWQTRDRQNILSPVAYQANETRLEAILRLSGFDQVRFLYSFGFTEFTPRPRLVYNAETGGASLVGNAGTPSDALGATITHNINERLKVLGSLVVYRGFLWNFEDTDFRVFSTDTRAFHGWLAIFSRLSRDMSVRFKYSFDWHAPRTNLVDARYDQGLVRTNPLAKYVSTHKFYSDFRIQFDYRF